MCGELPLELRPPDGIASRSAWAPAGPSRTTRAAATPARVRVLVVPAPRLRRSANAEQWEAEQQEDRDCDKRSGDGRGSGRGSGRPVRCGGEGVDMRDMRHVDTPQIPEASTRTQVRV